MNYCWCSSLRIVEIDFWKLKGALGIFWFVFASEDLRQVNEEVFAGCPCRKCPHTFNIFSQKAAERLCFLFWMHLSAAKDHIYSLCNSFHAFWLLRHRRDVLQWSKPRLSINLSCQHFCCLLYRYLCWIFHVWSGNVLSFLPGKPKLHMFHFSLKKQRGLVECVFLKVWMASSLKIILW